MKLSFDEIKSVTVGAVKVEQQENGIHFFKCTDEQNAFYASVSEGFGRGALTTTGVHLDFLTDAEKVAFTVCAGGKYEVYVGGLLCNQFIGSEVQTFEVSLPAGKENRVTICLASHGAGVIREIELVGATTFKRYEYSCKMLFLGDSITQGWNSKFDTHSFAYRVADFFDAECLNQGIGGTRFFPETVVPLSFDPDYVFIAFGTNDFSAYRNTPDPVGNIRAKASEYFDKIKALYGDKTVFVISPIPRGLESDDAYSLFRSVCDMIGSEAEAKGFVHVEGFDLIAMYPPLFADARLHPNDDGFSVYAENLIKKILPHVKR